MRADTGGGVSDDMLTGGRGGWRDSVSDVGDNKPAFESERGFLRRCLTYVSKSIADDDAFSELSCRGGVGFGGSFSESSADVRA